MGGDAFEGTERLTNEQYQQILVQLLAALQHICIRIEPYIPLPEKESHGDIDLLLMLKVDNTTGDIIKTLKLEQYKINSNNTINSVYRNKQVDFFVVSDDQEFALVQFYKSYSGFGAYLGLFLDSKEVKLSETGLYCVQRYKHLKLDYLVCDDIKEILAFYGLSYEFYCGGFHTRQLLFEFLRQVRFFDEEELFNHLPKQQTKLMQQMNEYIKTHRSLNPCLVTRWEDPKRETLVHFHAEQAFKEAFAKLLQEDKRKKARSSKFNATHIFELYKVDPKQMRKMKETFLLTFKDKQEHDEYIEKTDQEEIIKLFAKVCVLEGKEREDIV